MQKSILAITALALLISPSLGMGQYRTVYRNGDVISTYYSSSSNYPQYTYSRSLAPTSYYNDISSYRSSDSLSVQSYNTQSVSAPNNAHEGTDNLLFL